MTQLSERAQAFLQSIRAEGEKSCAKIRTQTDQQVEQALAATRNQEQSRAQHTIDFEVDRARVQANRALSREQQTARAKLAAHRQQLVDQVFAKVEQKLKDFVASPAYAKWLQNSADQLAKQLGNGAVLYARSKDCPLLEGKLPAGCTLKQDDSIQLGGLKGENNDLAADDTLKTRLNGQRDWFLQNADLALTI